MLISRRIQLLLLVLIIPIFGFAVSEIVQLRLDSNLQNAFLRYFPETDPNIVSNLTLDKGCEDQILRKGAIEDICSTNDTLNIISKASIVSASIGFILLFCIWFAGYLSRSNRWILFSLFKPGFYITKLSLIFLIIINAGIGMSAIYYGESALIGRIHVYLIGIVGLGALIGIGVLINNMMSMDDKLQSRVLSRELSPDDSPNLWNNVRDVANRIGTLNPDNIVIGLDPNFFVTEAEVTCLDGTITGRTMYCSLPLMRILNVDEFRAIVGHELAHFKGDDTKFSQKFYPIYRGTANSIYELSQTMQEGAKGIVLLPAILTLTYFMECFSVAESNISRERELIADKEGASITNPTTIATSLTKLHAFSGYWNIMERVAVDSMNKGNVFKNCSKFFADALAENADRTSLDDIAENHLSHPTDSHPPLKVRLEALGIFHISQIAEDSLKVKPVYPAIDLINEAEEKEAEISAAYQLLLARTHGIDLSNQEENPSS